MACYLGCKWNGCKCEKCGKIREVEHKWNVEAFTDEGHEGWLTAHVHALEWVGGVPRVIVPDNCNAARRAKFHISSLSSRRITALMWLKPRPPCTSSTSLAR